MIVSNKTNKSKIKKEDKDNQKKTSLEIDDSLVGLTTEDIHEQKQLRPSSFDQYIGQAKLVKQLRLIVESAKIRDKLPEHILFYGQPGLGKTTAAILISNELQANLKIISAPSLNKIGDLVSLLVNLESGTVLFIDEIHRLKAPLEEVLYTAIEDKKIDLIMGKGNGASVARLDLNDFVLVGATTQLGKVSKPLKDRFPTILQLEAYTSSEILELIDRNCQILKINILDEAKIFISRRSRGVPRIANNILKRLLDYQTVHSFKEINLVKTEDFLNEIGVFENGLTKADITYLKALSDTVLGLKTLAARLAEDVETVELVIEPYLIYLGYLNKSSEGRNLTPNGKKFIESFRI